MESESGKCRTQALQSDEEPPNCGRHVVARRCVEVVPILVSPRIHPFGCDALRLLEECTHDRPLNP